MARPPAFAPILTSLATLSWSYAKFLSPPRPALLPSPEGCRIIPIFVQALEVNNDYFETSGGRCGWHRSGCGADRARPESARSNRGPGGIPRELAAVKNLFGFGQHMR